MEFRILGPLEAVQHGSPLPLGGGRQRMLLALLLTRANEIVSADRLIDELWSAQPPRSAANALQYHVSQLRKVLPADTLLTREPGYVIQVEAEQLDLFRFESLVGRSQGAPPAEAARLLREALALWRGPPLGDLAQQPSAAGEIPAARGAPDRRRGAARRGRPRARAPRRARGRARAADRRVPVPRAPAGPAHAGALRGRPPGRGARCVSADPARPGRRAWHRAESRTAGARAGDAPAGSRAGARLRPGARARPNARDPRRRRRRAERRRGPRRTARPRRATGAHLRAPPRRRRRPRLRDGRPRGAPR